VSAIYTLMQSTLILIQGFSARLNTTVAPDKDGSTSDTRAANLRSNSDALAARVVTNTQADTSASDVETSRPDYIRIA
jgi:hypothetical protein